MRFAFDSAELSSAAKASLAHIADDIRHHVDRTQPIVLVGHTDSVGPAAYNERLSVWRAQAVRQALSQALGDGYRFQVTGKGESAPIAEETRPDGSDDPVGRARNRCVEITYTPRPTSPRAPSSAPPATSSPATPPRQSPQPTTTPPGTPQPRPSSPEAGAGAPTPTAASRPTAHPASPSPAGQRPSGPAAVRMRNGALAGLSMAAAISIAVAATRLHRRRRRTPDPDRLTLAEPEPALPQAVRTLRKAHLETYAAAGKTIPTDPQLLASDFMAEPPTHLTVGVHDGRQITVALSGLNIGFLGPGAADAARAIAIELLAGAHRSRIELLMPEPAATTLFALARDDLTNLADNVPGLIVTPDLDSALRHLETEILHRARMMTDHDAPDIPALRTADPAEPLPAIVLIAHADESERFTHALQANLQLAERYGIGALLLGPSPTGTTCHIDTDGQVAQAEGPHSGAWHEAQLFHLPATDAAGLLHVIRTAQGADEPTPTSRPRPDAEAQPNQAPDALKLPHVEEDQVRPVRVRMFGPVRVETGNGQVTTGLRRISRELLAFLALHPEGITREQGVDAILPDRDLESGSTMFHTAVNNTRQTLRKATGLREPMFITYAGGRYRLDVNLVDVDLWHFLHTLNAAADADNDPERIPALRRLADLYTGELADDLPHEWAEAERERIRRTATDALVRLARILQRDHPDDALAALEQAFDHDQTSEPLACELMRLQARLGQLDAVRRTHRLLAYRLNDLDIDPSEETERLVSDLLRRRKKPRLL